MLKEAKMVDAAIEKKTGAEDVLWDLSVFYPGTDAPAIRRIRQSPGDG